jgi:hypothetical protein
MTRGTRLFLIIVIGGTLLVLATLGAMAAAVYRAGTVAVEIEEHGHQFRLALPAGLIQAALVLLPDAALDEAASELAPLVPALEAGWREFVDAPDFVLLDARSADEHVLVVKSGSRLEIEVVAPDARVRVGVPLGTAAALLHELVSTR